MELLPKLKLHPVFLVNGFKPDHLDEKDPKRGEFSHVPLVITTFFDKEVEYIMIDHIITKKCQPPSHEYLVK